MDVNALVDQSITLTNPKWQCQAEASGATIQIVKKLRPVPLVSGAPAELREVLTNLIFNAVDAMPCGGMPVLNGHRAEGDGETPAVVEPRVNGTSGGMIG